MNQVRFNTSDIMSLVNFENHLELKYDPIKSKIVYPKLVDNILSIIR